MCVCFFLSFAKRDEDYTWAARILSCMPIDRWPMGKEGPGKGGREERRAEVVYICTNAMSVRCIHIAKKTNLLHKLHDHIHPLLPTSFLYIYDILFI